MKIMKKRVVISIIFLFILNIVYAPVEVETTTPEQYKQIWVKCEATVKGVTSIRARIEGANCESRGWLQDQPKIRFLCTVPAKSQAKVECYVDTSRSYTTSSPKSKTINPTPPTTPPTCGGGTYVSGFSCKQCGGVQFCSDSDVYYCGVDDGVCPSEFGANCLNHVDCNDLDC